MKELLVLTIFVIFFSCKNKQDQSSIYKLPCIQSFVQTYPSLNGNRVSEISGKINQKSLQVNLGGKPIWVTGISLKEQKLWAVALENGTVELITTQDRNVISHNKDWDNISPGTPPVLGVLCNDEPILINNLVIEAAQFAAPIPISKSRIAYISNTGNLMIIDDQDTVTIPINAMHDTRIIYDQNDRLLVLTDAVKYHHGVLGDHTEARGIAIINTYPEIKIQNQFMVPDNSVIEGVGAIWEDMNGDGELEIVVTLSNNAEGTGGKHAIFNENGDLLASGKSVKPDGWRHLLMAFKPTGSNDYLLAAIQRPHVDRLLNIYRWEGDSLKVIAQSHGFSTHIAGSRNLDGVLGTDINKDGNMDILLPCTTYDTLYAISYQNNMLKRLWSIPLSGRSITNFAVTGNGIQSAIAIGTDKNILEIWFAE